MSDTYTHFLKSDGQHTNLSVGAVLYRPGKLLSDVYFPQDAVCSIFVSSQIHKEPAGSAGIVVGLVGRGGAVGLVEALADTPPSTACIVQSPGLAFRVSAILCRDLARRDPQFRDAVWNFQAGALAQAHRLAACSMSHRVAARLASALLQMSELSGGQTAFKCTQDNLAKLLGAQRTYITRAALFLKQNGAMTYQRGRVEIIDTAALEAIACQCWRIDQRAPHGFMIGR